MNREIIKSHEEQLEKTNKEMRELEYRKKSTQQQLDKAREDFHAKILLVLKDNISLVKKMIERNNCCMTGYREINDDIIFYFNKDIYEYEVYFDIDASDFKARSSRNQDGVWVSEIDMIKTGMWILVTSRIE